MESATSIVGVDPLSDVLRAVRLTGAIFFLTEARAPWKIAVPAAQSFRDVVAPRPQHLVSYHAVTRGSCWCLMDGESPLRLDPGDVLVVPHGDPYALASAPDARARMSDAEVVDVLERLARRQLPFVVREGSEGGEQLEVLCGFLGCDVVPFNPVLATLPRRLALRRPQRPQRDRLDELIRFAMTESSEKEAGADCVLLRLSELMFVEVVRRYLASHPEQSGWFAALRDPVVGRALLLLHAHPARDWTLASLAREAGVSRTRLAERFAATAGQPPMQYLKQWRMQLAAGLLADGATSVAGVALRVGYGSEAAFSRAFKRAAGVSPSKWRPRHTGSRT